MTAPDALPPWRAVIRGARQRQGTRTPEGRWLQLATVAADGTPRVRTLVFRGWAGPTSLDLLSDGRGAKAAELALRPAVELCWLLPRARSQFRLRGQRILLPAQLEGRERDRHWRALSPAGRALWAWPAPGQPLDHQGSFPEAVAGEVPMPEHFWLLRLALSQVEALELTGHPHRRRRWRLATGWCEEPLNP
jgi:pyridoxamine 5'-phosphate oxidase